MTAIAFPPALGWTVWAKLLAGHPAERAMQTQGIVPILSRLTIVGTDATIRVDAPATATGVGPLLIGQLGAGAPNYPFRGAIDEVAIYNRVLTATEVQNKHVADKDGGNHGMPAGLALNATTGALTGTVTGAPVSLAAMPRTRPSVGFMAMARTRLSPICWATTRRRSPNSSSACPKAIGSPNRSR